MVSNIAVSIDVEHDKGRLIECGLTTIDLSKRKILKKYSIPIRVDFPISQEISKLTGWSNSKLNRCGEEPPEAVRLVLKHCSKHRLLVTDMDNEIPFLEDQLRVKLSISRLNICTLLKLKRGSMVDDLNMTNMLEYFGLTFEGKQHRGSDDSYNIARIFLELIK